MCVCVCLPWSRCRVGECVSAGGGLETSGWADREHTHCRCPSPYHSATLTHTERQSVCLIWLQLIVPLQKYHKSKRAINISVSPGRWCWTLIDNCRTNSRGSLTTSCMENKASVKLLLHLCKAPLTAGSVLILSSSWKRQHAEQAGVTKSMPNIYINTLINILPITHNWRIIQNTALTCFNNHHMFGTAWIWILL